MDYPDGTNITFGGKHHDLESITIDGKTYNYLKNESYNTFKKQGDYLDKLFKEGEFDDDGTPHQMNKYVLEKFADKFASYDGMRLNENLRKGLGLPSDSNIDKKQYELFVDFEKNNTIDDTDYSTFRVQTNLHNNDSIDKKFVSDDAHLSTSVGANKDLLTSQFVHGDDTDGNYWQIFTVVDKGSGTKGAFLGNSLKNIRGGDYESEVNFAPKQRFERLLIDENNKVIIQKPVVK